MSGTALAALQQALAGEHVAVFTYGVLGGRTSRSAQPALSAALASAYVVHRGRRDTLIRMIRDLGVEPAPSAPAYDVTGSVDTPTGVRAIARRLETGTAALYADVVAASDAQQRAWAIAALTDAAVREVSFGGKPVSFPGLSGLAGH